MRKKFLAVTAAAIMSMSFAMTAMADVTDYVGYYSFDGTLKNEAKGGSEATLTGSKASAKATATEAKFAEGKKGKAISFTGAGSYGLKLDAKITENNFSITFKTQVHATTFATPWVFIDASAGDIAEGAAPLGADELWMAIQPVTDADKFEANAPRIWAHNGVCRPSFASPASEGYAKDTWVDISYVQKDGMGSLYFNGTAVAVANISENPKEEDATKLPGGITSDDTRVYLGVNYWDVPLNGEIDELYIFDRALSDKELGELTGLTIKNDLKPIEIETKAPALAGKDAPYLVQTEAEEETDNTMLYAGIAAVAVVVVIVVAVVVMKSSKKKEASEDDDIESEE